METVEFLKKEINSIQSPEIKGAVLDLIEQYEAQMKKQKRLELLVQTLKKNVDKRLLYNNFLKDHKLLKEQEWCNLKLQILIAVQSDLDWINESTCMVNPTFAFTEI